jgi:hypothetical protein
MKRPFLAAWPFVLALSLAPSLAISFYYSKKMEKSFVSWTNWQQMAAQLPGKPLAQSHVKQALKPHYRQNILRQIWFRPLENGSSLYLKANQSEIRLESTIRGMKATEHFTDMEAGFQDQPFWTPLLGAAIEESPENSPEWILRVLKSNKAHFDYSRQLLQADEVDVRLYRLMRPLDFTRHPLPDENLANLRGHAKKVHLDCKSVPPQFKAFRFKARFSTKPLNESL